MNPSRQEHHRPRAGARSFPVLCCLLFGACHTPELATRYRPLHPDTNVDVEFRVEATAEGGIRKVELYLYEYEVAYVDVNGTPVGAARPGGAWGLVETWTYDAKPESIEEAYVHPGFPAGSYVKYLFRVTQRFGPQASESWSFAAGEWAFGVEPIPILTTRPPMWNIDVCFVADETDYTDGRAMLGDLEQLVYDGYHASNALEGEARKYWQFYYSPETGFISDDPGVKLELPDAVLSSGSLDAVAVIHSSVKQDWTYLYGPYFGTEPYNVGTALHESGHAVFHLDDEYKGGRHHVLKNPHHNNYDVEADAQAYNELMGWDQAEVESIEEGWWRPESQELGCIMFEDLDDELPDFARTCIRRIQWHYGLLEAKAWMGPSFLE